MAKKLDLTGQRFGILTALQPGEHIKGYTTWVCRCDCGQETIVKTVNLRSGCVKSCGCQRHTKIAEKEKSKPARKNNTSGVLGVEWLPLRKRWKATIYFNGKRYYLGAYTEFEDAVKARKRAEEAREWAEKCLQENFLRIFDSTRVRDADGVQEQNVG